MTDGYAKEHTLETVHVAAAAIRNEVGEVLLSKRHPGSHQGNLWEFPGGKLESGESVVVALRRELREELGIDALWHRPLIRIKHDYFDRRVILHVHLVTKWAGEPKGLEQQPLAWVLPSQMKAYSMPAADTPIIGALNLPSDYIITQPRAPDFDEFQEHLKKVLLSGVKLIQFRVFGLTNKHQRSLADRCLELCRQFGARMLVNRDVDLAVELSAHGVHVNSAQLKKLECRPVDHEMLFAASCHSLAELQLAKKLGVDFAVLSPVLPTQSHPDADLLGWDGFSALVGHINMPVYALGGMRPGMKQLAWTAGAQGLAGISLGKHI